MIMKFDANLPIYLQIMNEIKRRVVIGVYQSGQKVPSVRELAVEFGVNPNTVQRALSELERVELLASERTSGRFISRDESLIQSLRESIVNEKIDQFISEIKQYGCEEDHILENIRERLQNGKSN